MLTKVKIFCTILLCKYYQIQTNIRSIIFNEATVDYKMDINIQMQWEEFKTQSEIPTIDCGNMMAMERQYIKLNVDLVLKLSGMVDMSIGRKNMEVTGMNDKEHEHYMQILVKHDRERTSWNDRLNYWEQYRKLSFWKNRQ